LIGEFDTNSLSGNLLFFLATNFYCRNVFLMHSGQLECSAKYFAASK